MGMTEIEQCASGCLFEQMVCEKAMYLFSLSGGGFASENITAEDIVNHLSVGEKKIMINDVFSSEDKSEILSECGSYEDADDYLVLKIDPIVNKHCLWGWYD